VKNDERRLVLYVINKNRRKLDDILNDETFVRKEKEKYCFRE
jgi:hypothetical protein